MNHREERHEDEERRQDGLGMSLVFERAPNNGGWNIRTQIGRFDDDMEGVRRRMGQVAVEEDDAWVEEMQQGLDHDGIVEQFERLQERLREFREIREERRARRYVEAPTFYQERQLSGTSSVRYDRSVDETELVTAHPDFDPQQFFLRRMTACVGWAVHGLVFEFADGKRMGYILSQDGRNYLPLTDENISRRQGVGWTDIEYGDYIVAIHGNHLIAGPNSKWFCHTVVLEFASGRSVRYQPNNGNWRGEPFSYTVPEGCLVYRITFGHAQKECMRGLITSLHLPISRPTLQYLPNKYQQVVQDVFGALQLVDLDLVETGGTCPPLGDDLWWTVLGMLGAWQLSPT